jgi:hypothetical protein
MGLVIGDSFSIVFLNAFLKFIIIAIKIWYAFYTLLETTLCLKLLIFYWNQSATWFNQIWLTEKMKLIFPKIPFIFLGTYLNPI